MHTHLLPHFIANCHDRQLSKNTIDNYRHHLADRFDRPHLEPLQWAAEHADGRRYAPSTVNLRLAILSAWHTWLVEIGETDSNPIHQLRRPKPGQPDPQPLSRHDIAAAMSQTDTTTRMMIALGCWAGLRQSEIAAIQHEHIDHSNRTVRVHRGKGGRSRVVPAAERLLDYHRQMPRESPYLFPGRSGGPVVRHTVQCRVTEAFKKVGVSMNTHRMRASFATHYYEESRDLLETSRLLGHASPQTTLLYVKHVVSGHEHVDRLAG